MIILKLIDARSRRWWHYGVVECSCGVAMVLEPSDALLDFRGCVRVVCPECKKENFHHDRPD